VNDVVLAVRQVEWTDASNGNTIRIIDDSAVIYMETHAQIQGVHVHSLVRVPRDRFVTEFLGWMGK
jgi:hypothetical protein